jgi:hypothetical protein
LGGLGAPPDFEHPLEVAPEKQDAKVSQKETLDGLVSKKAGALD